MNTSLRRALPAVPLALLALAAAACGSDPTPVPTPTPLASAVETSPPTPTPAVESPAQTPTPAAPAVESSTPDAPAVDSPAPTATATAAVDSAPFERSTGEVDGVVFVVSEGSKATFSVDEVLASGTLPDYEAVMQTIGLTGEVRLDGGLSQVTIDLQSMTSDQEFRDRYVRSRMFPSDRSATITFDDLTPLPDGFTAGDEVATDVVGTLNIKGYDAPLTFAVQARDDGGAVFVLGRTTFTWDDLQLPKPSARSVVSLGDEVRVEVLLALEPQPAS